MDLDKEQEKRSSGIRIKASKKVKLKKIPQRGLGVAQLERLRLAEQQRMPASRGAACSSNLPQGLVLPPQSSAAHAMMANESIARQRTNPSLLFDHALPSSSASPDIDFFISGSSSALENYQISTSGNAWNDFLSMMGNPGAPPGPLATVPVRMEDAMSSNWQSVFLVQPRPSLHQQQQSKLVTMAKNTQVMLLSSLYIHHQQTAAISILRQAKKSIPSSSSSLGTGGLDPLQMEPPSNQSYTRTYDLLSSWKEQAQDQDQETMGSLKRPYPFQTDGMTAYPPSQIPATPNSLFKLEESSPSHGISFTKAESQRLGVRGGCSSLFIKSRSSTTQIDGRNKENSCQADGNFLTLGSVSPQTSNPMLSSSSNHSDSVQHGIPGSQGSSSSNVYNSSSQEKPFFSFMPPAKNIHEMDCIEEIEETVEDDIDLTLKL